MAKLTLFSAYNYCKAHGENLFEAFDAIPDIDADLLTNVLLIRGGEFGLIYPDTDFLKMQVETSVKKWQHTIARWVKIQSEDYNPIHNYDRYEEYTDTENASGTQTAGGSSTVIDDTTNTESKAAYDSNALQTNAQSKIDGTTTNTTNNSATQNNNRELVHTAHLFGNIGVTTTSQLQTEARKAEAWNLYENIAGLFIADWCIPIYI